MAAASNDKLRHALQFFEACLHKANVMANKLLTQLS